MHIISFFTISPYWKQQPYDYGGEQLPSGNLNVFGPGTNYGGQQHPSRAYGAYPKLQIQQASRLLEV